MAIGKLWLSRKKHAEPPIFLEWRSSSPFIIFVVVFAVFTDILLYGLIVPVTPTALHERVGLSEGEEQRWTSILLALYGAALLAFSPIAGYIADKIQSRWWPLMIGLIALGAATALLCVGNHMGLWVAGRLFQGASAAVVWTVGCALVVDTVKRDELGQAIGYIGMGMTLGIMGGPLLGGVIYEHGGYYAVFGLAFGLVGLDIVFRLVMIEKKHAVRWLPRDTAREEAQDKEITAHTQETDNQKSLDKPQPTSTSSGQLPNAPEPPTESDAAPAQSVTPQPRKKALGALQHLLASERMLVSLWAYFIVSVVLTCFDSVLPLYVEETFGWAQTAQGLIFIPLSVPHILDPLVGYVIDKYGESRRYMAGGALIASVPILVLLRFVTHNSMGQKVLLCALLTLTGVCIAVLLPPVMVEASYVVQDMEEQTPEILGKGGAMALSYGLLNSAFAAGTIVGPFFAGFIRESAGWGTMTWAMAILTGVSAVPSLLCLGGFRLKRRKSVGS
ncbi:MFS transporter [Aspergillus affinis]|uniref:MFS transporter n=1 Tax=Aspergillus affinis TaxID=1070780 RepID=UPI0022FEC849|nr:MFS general substrate transporter [Aspergillus affinis]KAI9039555.1 MFS general substrate transporter [Aspergillus affinis]